MGGDGTGAVEEPLIPELVQVNPEPLVQETVNIEPEPVSAPAAPAAAATEVPMANQMLLTVPTSRYALQLAALQSKPAAVEFLQQYGIEDSALVYETRRNGEPWFMVLLGDYPSVAEARRAELQLPANIQALGPWAKSFVQIHKEIALVN